MCACSLAALALKLKEQSTNLQLVQCPDGGSNRLRTSRPWVQDKSTGLTAYHRLGVADGDTEAIAGARWGRPCDRPIAMSLKSTQDFLRRRGLGLTMTMLPH
jgi:hypothetical protein